MKQNRFNIITLALLLCSAVSAQTSFDVSSVIGQDLNGTARYVGMGGAMSAFGNDISVIKTNPAGIGTYKSYDANISMSLFHDNNKMAKPFTGGIYLGNGDIANAKYLSRKSRSGIQGSIDNASFVISTATGGYNSLSFVNIGFSYRRLRDIDRTTDYYDELVDYSEYRDFGNNEESTLDSYDFNLSFNYQDQFYWGFTVGILNASYWSNGHYYHCYTSALDNLSHDYTSVDFMNKFDGNGVDFAVGAIYRPISNLRFGLSLKTPTWYSIDHRYSDYLYVEKDVEKTGDLYTSSTSYEFTSPWTMNVSAGLTFGTTAIGVEYERNFADGINISVSNTKMEDQGTYDLQSYNVFKVGIEQNINKLSLRAGYMVSTSIFKENTYKYLADSDFNKYRRDSQTDRTTLQSNITFGAGYCSEPSYVGSQFYIDAAYVVGIRKSTLAMGGNDAIFNYATTPLPSYPNYYSDYTDNIGKLVITAGFYF